MVGGLAFAYVGEWLYKKKPSYMPLLCGFGVLAGIVPALLLVNLSIENVPAYLALGFVTGALVSVAAANVPAMIMNVNRPEHRGTVFSVFNITNNIGQGLGPAIGIARATGVLFMMNFAVPGGSPAAAAFDGRADITKDRDTLRALLASAPWRCL